MDQVTKVAKEAVGEVGALAVAVEQHAALRWGSRITLRVMDVGSGSQAGR
jgi:hypothetical protein